MCKSVLYEKTDKRIMVGVTEIMGRRIMNQANQAPYNIMHLVNLTRPLTPGYGGLRMLMGRRVR